MTTPQVSTSSPRYQPYKSQTYKVSDHGTLQISTFYSQGKGSKAPKQCANCGTQETTLWATGSSPLFSLISFFNLISFVKQMYSVPSLNVWVTLQNRENSNRPRMSRVNGPSGTSTHHAQIWRAKLAAMRVASTGPCMESIDHWGWKMVKRRRDENASKRRSANMPALESSEFF